VIEAASVTSDEDGWHDGVGRGGTVARLAAARGHCPLPVSPAAIIGSVLAGWALGGVVRRVSVRTGVSDAEALGPLPGDDIISHPMVEWTRGITVRTTPPRVWPWLAQMGYGRGGWYTPEWVDLLANRWVFGAGAGSPPAPAICCPNTSTLLSAT